MTSSVTSCAHEATSTAVRPSGGPYSGSSIDPAAEFAVAINNYRQNGGGGFPHVVGAPILWNSLADIREAIIDWVKVNLVIDPGIFVSVD